MERERSGKIIAIATLVVGIIGLSLGFAAFSTTLHISSSADVPIDASVWKVGFSNTTNSIPTTAQTVNGQTNSANNGTLSLTQFVISQGTNATLHTTNNEKVEYEFYVVNTGELTAYLNSITMGDLTCAYAPSVSPRVTDGGYTTITGGTGTIAPADCQSLFTATLTLDVGDTDEVSKTNGQTQSSGFTDNASIPAGGHIPAKLTIAYINDSIHANGVNAPNGDFVVSLGDSTVVYGSTAN